MPRASYVLDVPYVRVFLEDLSPARLRLVAALHGLPPPPAEEFTHADFGCGYGDTTATLAAAYPRARFVGIDLNAEHIAAARDTCARGEVGNAAFVEGDFTRLAEGDLPALDYAASLGVLSWVAPETRDALLATVARHLKPGGLFLVGYNAMPGSAALEPLRRLLVDAAAATQGGSLAQAEAGVALAQRLAAAGARYFARNPPAADMVATMQKAGLPYVVHEFLHEHWTPLYFADLARAMARHDLHFVGQLPLFLNERELAVPPGALPALHDARDRVAFETLAAYATNQVFRRDVFVKGPAAPSDAVRDATLDATPFGVTSPAGIARVAHLLFHAVHYTGDVFDALVPALLEGAATARDLAERASLAPFGVPRVRAAMLRLLLGGQIAPMLHATRARSAPAASYVVPSAFNRAVLARAGGSGAPLVLASPVAGNGIVPTPAQADALRTLTRAAQTTEGAAAVVDAPLAKLVELEIVAPRP